jgi:hypothetical protein
MNDLDVADLKQACLDISKAACEIFDGLDRHGDEAPWLDRAVLQSMVDLAITHKVLADHFRAKASLRLGTLLRRSS